MTGVQTCALPISTTASAPRLEEFREHLGGRLTVTLPDGIGQKIEVHEMNSELLAEAVEQLRERSLI